MSAPPPSAIHEPKVIIDGNGNTEVMNNILGFCDRRTLFAWRRVNHRFQYEADSLLAHHVVFTFLMEGEPVEGKPNGSMFGLVDPLGRFLPGSPDTVVIVGKGETLPSLISKFIELVPSDPNIARFAY
ncbi:hypothetical protein Q8F55_002995 [Vanrija albida]|uniref:Uncharacterized protein n=1 Tax=Vanrija albida TaxID=181172 RepID=A0ABR3QBB2_9TREE